LRDHANAVSYIQLGAWWKYSLMYVTPLLLGTMTIYNLWTEVTTPYSDYPWSGLVVVGWGVVALTLMGAITLHQVRKSHEMRLDG
jgi:NSS family neurotransmitter:Na+ symporter